MAGASVLRAGKAVIEFVLTDKSLAKGLKAIEHRAARVGEALKNVGRIGIATASMIGAPLVAAIKYASDAQESLSRFKQLFGEQADAAGKFADSVAKAVGRSAVDIKDGLSSFQAFFVGLGFSAEKSRELSQQLSTLSLDFASFNNLSDSEAQERFISALSGSSEVLDKFGVNIKQVALQEKLLEMGVKKAWTEVTEQEKAMARLAIIAEAMGEQGAVGDAARTAGSFANRMKALQGTIKDTAIIIGNALLPVVTPLIEKTRDVASRFAEWAKKNPELIRQIADITAKIGLFSLAAVSIGGVLGSLSTIFGTVTSAVGLLRTALIALSAHPIIAALSAVALIMGKIAYDTLNAEESADGLANNIKRAGETPDDAVSKAAADFDNLMRAKKAPQGVFSNAPETFEQRGDRLLREKSARQTAERRKLDSFRGFSYSDMGQFFAGALAPRFAMMNLANAGSSARANFQLEGMREGRNLDDEIAREKINSIHDTAERERALIEFEKQQRMRELRESGHLSPELQAKLDALAELQIANLDPTVGGGTKGASAILDAAFAGQQFGGGDEELNVLKEIRDDGRKRDRKPQLAKFG